MKVNAAGTFNNLSHIFFPLHVSVFIHPFRLHFLPLLHKRKKKILLSFSFTRGRATNRFA